MMELPKLTWPSPPMATLPLRRTVRIVVARIFNLLAMDGIRFYLFVLDGNGQSTFFEAGTRNPALLCLPPAIFPKKTGL